jgi:FtsZ-interacting cell division protein YlmF
MENSSLMGKVGQKIKEFFMPEINEETNSEMIDETPLARDNTTYVEPPRKRNSKDSLITPVETVTTAQIKIHKYAPVYYKEAGTIGESVVHNRIVALNLESPTESERRRILDFVAGVALAKNATVHDIGGLNILILPYGIPFEDKTGDGNIVSAISEQLAAGIL